MQSLRGKKHSKEASVAGEERARRGEMRSGAPGAFLRRRDEEELARRPEGTCDGGGGQKKTQEKPTVGHVLGTDDSVPNLSLPQPPLDGRSTRAGSLLFSHLRPHAWHSFGHIVGTG